MKKKKIPFFLYPLGGFAIGLAPVPFWLTLVMLFFFLFMMVVLEKFYE